MQELLIKLGDVIDESVPSEIAEIIRIVVEESKTWPLEIQQLIQEAIFPLEEWQMGVSYLIGRLVRIAEVKLREELKIAIRNNELQTAKKLSPLISRRKSLYDEFKIQISLRLQQLGTQRDSAIEKSRALIRKEYDRKIDDVRKSDLPAEIDVLDARMQDLKRSFEAFKAAAKKESSSILTKLNQIYETRSYWDTDRESVHTKNLVD
ncbi:MAG: hypothetical protein ACFFFC_00505 [Candidatus Thorarchaeota archaeon]